MPSAASSFVVPFVVRTAVATGSLSGSSSTATKNQEPRQVVQPTAITTVRKGPEAADQAVGISLIRCSIWDLGHGGSPFPPTRGIAARSRRPGVDTRLGAPGLAGDATMPFRGLE